MIPSNPYRNTQRISVTEHNIRRVCALEAESLRGRSRLERVGDTIALQAGRPWCIIFHVVWFGLWIGINTIKPFDPFPYQFLTTAVSLESIFLALFLLMSQNRGSAQAEERAHLDLQINLLAEGENTKMLQMLQALCAHHHLDVARDPEVEKLAGEVNAADVVAEIKKHTVKPA